jgi:UDP-N-acetylmuramyl tripeptide synthase
MKKSPEIIIDRREAIARALALATTDDAVLITGKGTDPNIAVANGKKIPWSDATVAREELTQLLGAKRVRDA